MEKVFVDTNVLLDFILGRDGEISASDLFQIGEEGRIYLCVSYLTMANAAYVARKHRTREELYEYLSELVKLFKILPNDEGQYLKALTCQVADFEDYLQCICAQEHDCDVIITNNTKHFTDTHIPVFTPQQYLAQFHNR